MPIKRPSEDVWQEITSHSTDYIFYVNTLFTAKVS